MTLAVTPWLITMRIFLVILTYVPALFPALPRALGLM